MKRMTTTHAGIAVVATIAASGLAIGTAATAIADPTGVPIELLCDHLGPVAITVNGNGPLTPGHAISSTQVGVPYALRIEGTFTPIGGQPEPFLDEYSHPAPHNGRLDHCTMHQEGSLPEGSFELDGQVWIAYTPAN